MLVISDAGKTGDFRRRGPALSEQHEKQHDKLCKLLVADLKF